MLDHCNKVTKKDIEVDTRLSQFESDVIIFSNYLSSWARISVQDQIMNNLKCVLTEEQVERIQEEKKKVQ